MKTTRFARKQYSNAAATADDLDVTTAYDEMEHTASKITDGGDYADVVGYGSDYVEMPSNGKESGQFCDPCDMPSVNPDNNTTSTKDKALAFVKKYWWAIAIVAYLVLSNRKKH